jgi:Kef-type K+ transport system membrane component KefB
MDMFAYIEAHGLALPLLAKFAIGMAFIVGIPPLSRRLRLPAVVGLLLSGILIGPHGLDIIGQHRPIADFFADLGKLLLMFFAGLEIDLTRFRQSKRRTAIFGLVTTSVPQLLGTAVGLLFGYGVIPAIVLGSLLASHTLLAAPIINRLGANRLESVTVTFGATVISDTLSLVVFAICVSTFKGGFSPSLLAVQLVEIAIFIPLILVGLSRVGAYVLAKVQDDEHAYFVVMLALLAVAALLAQLIDLPGIVGAFLAGLAVNAAVQSQPAKTKLEFFGNSLFIPIFFIVTGCLIDLDDFFHTLYSDFPLVVGVIGALVVGKWIAAQTVGRAFGYAREARMTMWSLTLPQVAATLAAALVAFETFDPAGKRLIDGGLLNVVLVLMLATSILGPLMTEHFAPRMLEEDRARADEGRLQDGIA